MDSREEVGEREREREGENKKRTSDRDVLLRLEITQVFEGVSFFRRW